MSVYFEANAFIDGGQVQNLNITSCTIGNSSINTSSLDMNMANITSVKDPINNQDAATKKYVDNLEIILKSITLTGTSYTEISTNVKGSYIVTISNEILNGPSAIFHVTKSETTRNAHIVRTVASPGYMSNVFLELSWNPNSTILLKKTGNQYDGSYKVKIM
jgi:hypothetical protein